MSENEVNAYVRKITHEADRLGAYVEDVRTINTGYVRLRLPGKHGFAGYLEVGDSYDLLGLLSRLNLDAIPELKP